MKKKKLNQLQFKKTTISHMNGHLKGGFRFSDGCSATCVQSEECTQDPLCLTQDCPFSFAVTQCENCPTFDTFCD